MTNLPLKHILALDPGTTETAWLQWDGERILNRGTERNASVLDHLRSWRSDENQHLAIEMIASYGMAVGKEVFETCLWIGRFAEAWDRKGERTWELIYRLKVKQHLCHDTKAKDSNIRQALIDRLGPPGLKKSPGVTFGVSKHLWAALAVAVYAYDNQLEAVEKTLPRHLQTHSCEKGWVK